MIRMLMLGLCLSLWGWSLVVLGQGDGGYVNNGRAQLTVAETNKIKNLFNADKLAELNTLLEAYYQRYRENIEHEMRLVKAVELVCDGPPERYRRWLNLAEPNYMARFAQACSYSENGWQARTSRYFDRVSDSQFAQMRQWFSKSQKLLFSVLDDAPDFIPAYLLLVSQAGAESDAKARDWVTRKGLSNAPLSVELRRRYMSFLQPKWGGDIKLIHVFAGLSKRYESKNPQLKSVRAHALALEADYYRSIGKMSKAISLYRKADAIYPAPHSSEGLTKALAAERRFDEGLQAATAAVNLTNGSNIKLRLVEQDYIRWKYGREASMRSLARLMKDFPYSDKVHARAGGLADRDKNYLKAIGHYSDAIEIAPDQAYLYVGRGELYANRIEDFNASKADFNSAIKLEPDNHQALAGITQAHVALRELEAVDAAARYLSRCHQWPGECGENHQRWITGFFNCVTSDEGCGVDGKRYGYDFWHNAIKTGRLAKPSIPDAAKK